MKQAKTIWEAMKDVDNECPMTHDGEWVDEWVGG